MRFEDIKGGAQLGVEHCDLEGAGRGPADIGLVGEVEHAWGLWIDEFTLEARLAEDEDLGFDGHAQLGEQPLESLLRRHGANLHGAALELGADCRRAVVRRRRRVVDWRLLKGLDLLCRRTCRQRTHQSDDKQDAKEGGHAFIIANPPLGTRG